LSLRGKAEAISLFQIAFFRALNLTKMVEKEVELVNEVGLHIRPASMLVEVANKFKSDVWIEKDGQEANGKSIMSILLLCAEKGSKVNIKAEGPDATQAVEALVRVVKDKFGEE